MRALGVYSGCASMWARTASAISVNRGPDFFSIRFVVNSLPLTCLYANLALDQPGIRQKLAHVHYACCIVRAVARRKLVAALAAPDQLAIPHLAADQQDRLRTVVGVPAPQAASDGMQKHDLGAVRKQDAVYLAAGVRELELEHRRAAHSPPRSPAPKPGYTLVMTDCRSRSMSRML